MAHTSACDELSRAAQARSFWLVWSIRSVLFVWLDQRDQIDRTDQIDQMNGILGWAACWWPAAAAAAIGRTMAETGEADGDGGAFAWRAADGD